jgi:repressor LexA
MRTKDRQLLTDIKQYVEDYCDAYGYGPSVMEVAAECNIAKATAYRYLTALKDGGELSTSPRKSMESNSMSESRETTQVMKLGYVPCGPLQDITSFCDGYVRLPRSLVGPGKFFILTADGESMINAGINDGDAVLIRQQNNAEIGQIIVALVGNEVTLKRLAYNAKRQVYYLHPENDEMEDIYVNQLEIQGVAVKVVKDLV